MLRLINNIYLPARFFIAYGSIASLFALGFAFSFFISVAQTMLIFVSALIIVDVLLLYSGKERLKCVRKLPNMFSLGDDNKVSIELENRFSIPLNLEIIDELPYQFQIRNFKMFVNLTPGEKKKLSHNLRPVIRGKYIFNNINIYLLSKIGLIQRRVVFEQKDDVSVYPSVIQMKKYELKSMRTSYMAGLKKVRRLGHSYEFEKIKSYVQGDDVRCINWKATSRRNSLMVNQYEDERSQQVFSVIDKSRSMQLPFNGLSLLDYAINTSLVIANTALQKHDKAGLLTFSKEIESIVKAEKGHQQLRKILEVLYNEKESDLEANYEMLYLATKNSIKGRSLIFLYTNFESYYALKRVLPILRKINSRHVLVVMFFDNTEIHDFTHKTAEDIQDVYNQTIAQKFLAEKFQIARELKQYGILTILNRPEDLSINSINKYLELKSMGVI